MGQASFLLPLTRGSCRDFGIEACEKEGAPPPISHQGLSKKASTAMEKAESRRQRALDREFAKAQKVVARRASKQRSDEQVSPCPFEKVPLVQDSLQLEEMSPDSDEDLPLSLPDVGGLDFPQSRGLPSTRNA